MFAESGLQGEQQLLPVRLQSVGDDDQVDDLTDDAPSKVNEEGTCVSTTATVEIQIKCEGNAVSTSNLLNDGDISIRVDEDLDSTEEQQYSRDEENSNVEDQQLISSMTSDMRHISVLLKSLRMFVDAGGVDTVPIVTKVPENLQKLNEDIYSPRLISIGPLHHKKGVEVHSMRDRYAFIDKYLRNRKLGFDLNDIAGIAIKHKKETKSCFPIDVVSQISDQDLMKICVYDSIFMIELFIGPGDSSLSKMATDPWMRRDIFHDMLLLENQIPCHLLKELFVHRDFLDGIPLYKWIHGYFKNAGNMTNLEPKDYTYFNILDFLRKYHCPSNDDVLQSVSKQIEDMNKCTHTAKELQMAGIKFRKETGLNKHLMDIKFSVGDGILTIPQLIINEWSETFYLNLIAFEQANPRETRYINSYFILMESLARNHEDVNLLIEHQIIKNSLGNNEQIRSLFANLRRSIAVDAREFYFNDLCHDLNHYSKSYWHRMKGSWYKWKKMLGRDYFNSPWSTISVIAAFILLCLTVIQTACSIISVK